MKVATALLPLRDRAGVRRMEREDQMRQRIRYWTGFALLAMGLAAAPAVAQFGGNTGGIDGKVVDEQGGVLPGVSVTVTGPGAPQTVYSDARGEFHVINLAPGTYTVTLALQGFSTINRENVTVALGRNTELQVPMKLSSVASTVTVSCEVPVISTQKAETGAALDEEGRDRSGDHARGAQVDSDGPRSVGRTAVGSGRPDGSRQRGRIGIGTAVQLRGQGLGRGDLRRRRREPDRHGGPGRLGRVL